MVAAASFIQLAAIALQSRSHAGLATTTTADCHRCGVHAGASITLRADALIATDYAAATMAVCKGRAGWKQKENG